MFSLIGWIFCGIAMVGVAAVIDFYNQFGFWKRKNVPYLKPSFPLGNISDILKSKMHFGYLIQNIYTQMKPAGDYCGIFFSRIPVLLVLTPEFAKTVLVRDFHHFADRGMFCNESIDPLGANLFFVEGQRWKDIRSKLTPTFSSGKLKKMFGLILDVGDKFVELLKPTADAGNDIDLYDLFARYTTDCISSCAFGFDAKSLENPKSDFVRMGRKVLHFSKLKALKIFFAIGFRKQSRALGIRFNDKDVEDFFLNVVHEAVEYRKKSGFKRDDFLQRLIEMIKETDEDVGKFLFKEMAAQAFGFYFAGFDSSSTTLAFTTHFLAFNQDVQKKARISIKNALAKHNNEFSYDALVDMSYIDQVIDESLRINPPVTTIHRVVTKDYMLPNGALLKEGNVVVIPNLAFQRDPEIFPDPLKFDPERFSENAKRNRSPFSSLPFGEGPRYCLGMRFGLLQIKLAIAMLVNNFVISPCDRTDNPVKVDIATIIHAPLGEVFLNLKRV